MKLETFGSRFVQLTIGLICASQTAKTALWLEANLHRLNRAKIGYADHYHADYVKPYWAKGRTPTITIGKHLFYKLK